jgi:hypothetical protein
MNFLDNEAVTSLDAKKVSYGFRNSGRTFSHSLLL